MPYCQVYNTADIDHLFTMRRSNYSIKLIGLRRTLALPRASKLQRETKEIEFREHVKERLWLTVLRERKLPSW
jgi:hypothetical protein